MALFGIFGKKKKSKKTTEIKKESVLVRNTEAKNDAPKVSKPEANSVSAEKIEKAEEKKIETKADDSKKAVKATVKAGAKKPEEKASVEKAEEKKTEDKTSAQKSVKKTAEASVDKDPAASEPKNISKIVEPEAKPTSNAYTGKFEINKSKDGKKYFFNLYASNKVGIATSQMYSTAQNALNGVKSVIANAPKAPIEDQSLKSYETLPYPKWEIYVDNGGKFRFRLSASNGSCVCHSQGYTTKTACKNGIDSIIRSSRNAEIDKTYIAKKDED